MCSAHSTVRGLLGGLPAEAGTIVVDLEASPEHLTRATIEHVDLLAIVAEPYFKSLETARRYHALATDLGIPRVGLVGNRVDPADDVVAEYAAERGFEYLGAIPFDAAFPEAERLRMAPIDHEPGSPGVAAIGALAERIEAAGVTTAARGTAARRRDEEVS